MAGAYDLILAKPKNGLENRPTNTTRMANLPGVSSSKDVGQGVPLTKRTLYSTSLGRILAKIDPANQAFWGFFLYLEQIECGPSIEINQS